MGSSKESKGLKKVNDSISLIQPDLTKTERENRENGGRIKRKKTAQSFHQVKNKRQLKRQPDR